MKRRALPALLVVLAALVTLGVAGPRFGSSSAQAGTAPTLAATVFIGTGGLTWSDVSPERTPALWTLMRDGSSAAMSIRSVTTNACPTDGWLGLSAGTRAGLDRGSSPKDVPCPSIPAVRGATVPGWAAYVSEAAAPFDARLGLLGQSATRAGLCVQAVGPGAAIAAAQPDGRVEHYATWNTTTLVASLNACPLTIVDVGALRDPADVAEGEETSGSRDEQIAEIDRKIGETIAAAPGGADVIVGSLSDAGRTERLRLAVARGPHFGPGTLVSSSTKQRGLIQAQDLTPTILATAGVAVPPGLGGAVLTRTPAEDNSETRARDRLQALVDFDQASHEVHGLVPPFFTVFAYGQLVIYLFVLLVWKGTIGSAATRLRTLRLVRVVGVCAASVPASTFLANLLPWWRFSVPMLAVVAAVGVFVAVIATVALRGPWGQTAAGPMATVAAVTMAVLAGDVITGSRLQLSSLMGLQPVVAGRFYGMGNVTFALFATSALLLATALSSSLVAAGRRRAAAAVVLGIGLVAVVVDGAPFWGADGGGPPALLPGLAYLALSVLGITVTWRRGLLIGLGSALVFVLVAVLDWLRPPGSRTHLGNFVDAVLDGGALDIVVRKAQQNVSILLGNAPLTLLVPAALLFVIYVLARPTSWGSRALQRAFEAVPTLRPGLIALVITLTIGFAVNDSGTAIPAVGATIAVPLIVSVAVTALQEEARSRAQTRSARRG